MRGFFNQIVIFTFIKGIIEVGLMKIECNKCHTVYLLNENRLHGKPRAKVRCRHCQNVMSIDISRLKTTGQTGGPVSLPENLDRKSVV